MLDWAGERASGWRWFRARARRMRDLYDLVRADHVVGLFRTWGFRSAEDAGAFDPPDEPAQIAQGREILEMLRDEIAPARLVAEDLGVIPPWVRETLRELDTPGYKIFRWEHDEDGQLVPPSAYPECSLAATGTHDTDTLVAWWRTASPEERARACAALEVVEPAPETSLDEATRLAMLERLWASPSRYVVVPLQDLFGWEERVNVPATVGGANWRWRLPFRIADLPRDERIAALVRGARR
jgi:4-alpha-glucanotransferase